MNEQSFQSKLAELVQEISMMPKRDGSESNAPHDESRRRREKLQQSVVGLQDSLDYLRLSVKYLLFDLEATRRENEHLRRMLEEEPDNGF